jgi:2-aminoadipate transaminase
VGEALLDPGDVVLCAAPTYFVFLGMLDSLGARAVGVAADRDGMMPEALDQELARRQHAGELESVKAIYLTSYYDNPSTATLSLARRAQIVEIAKRWSRGATIYVIDDAAYRELRYTGHDVPSLRSFDDDGDTVIVAETFSKSFSPGMRVGWGILPPALVPAVAGLKANIDFGSPQFNQHVMAAVLERRLFEPHVARLRSTYRAKLDAMLSALSAHLAPMPGISWEEPAGGLYVWLRVRPGTDTGPGGRLMQNALDEGVLYVPGAYCFPAEGEPARADRIRLSFGVPSAENIRRGIAALARAIGRTP